MLALTRCEGQSVLVAGGIRIDVIEVRGDTVRLGIEAPRETLIMRQEIARCRVCGCTDHDCRGCIARTGRPCHWVEPDLCSACASVEG